MKSELKVAGGKLLRAECKGEKGVLKAVKFTGDFFLMPEESIQQLEEVLKQTPIEESVIAEKIESFFNSKDVFLIGVEPKHFTEVIMKALT